MSTSSVALDHQYSLETAGGSLEFSASNQDPRRDATLSSRRPRNYFPGEDSDEEPEPEPDMTRFLSLLNMHGLAIVPPGDLQPAAQGPSLGLGGAFGDVYFAEWKTGATTTKFVAVKQFKAVHITTSPDKEAERQYVRVLYHLFFECDIMGRCIDKNITKLLGICFRETEDEEDNIHIQPMLLLEPSDAEYPDLRLFCESSTRTRPINPQDIGSLASGIAHGLCALHGLGVIHADLKPENVLMFQEGGSWIPKLTDFGLSGITANKSAPRGGTLRWLAPECLPSPPSGIERYAATQSRDVYSFGLILAYMLQDGQGPFDPTVPDINAIKLDQNDIVFQHVWKRTSKAILDVAGSDKMLAFEEVLQSTLRLEPKKRWQSLEQVEMLLTPQLKPRSSWFLPLLRRSILGVAPRPAYIPFGSTKVTDWIEDTDISSYFVLSDIAPFINASNSLPSSLQKMLAKQCVRMIESTPVDKLPFVWKILAFQFIPHPRLQTLLAEKPDLQNLLTSFSNDYIGSMHRAWTADKGAPFRKHEDLFEQMDHHHTSALGSLLGLTPLNHAAYEGKLDHITSLSTQYLINDQQSRYKWTPLHSAVIGGQVRAAKLLLDLGADVNLTLEDRHTSVLRRFYWQFGKRTMQWSTSFFDVKKQMSSADDDGKVLDLLLRHDRNLAHAKDQRNRTPLYRACSLTRLAAVKLLVQAGANVNARDAGRLTPLHTAYAGGNGLPGAQMLLGPSEMPQQERVLFYRGVNLDSYVDSIVAEHRFALDMCERILKECPPDHDPFIHIQREKLVATQQGLTAGFGMLFKIISEAIKTDPSRFPYIRIPPLQDASWEMELNVRRFVEHYRQRTFIMINTAAKGQQSVTYLPVKKGREVVSYLLRKGAEADAIDTVGYSPECRAYKPTDLIWTTTLNCAVDMNFEPKAAWARGGRTRSPTPSPDPNIAEKLYLYPFIGDFSLWAWRTVIPCPSNLVMTVAMGRFNLAENLLISNFTLVVEVIMYPPNDAHNKQETLLMKEFKLHELLPCANRDYTLYLGEISLKHKCNLLISIRSKTLTGEIIGGLTFYNIRLKARAAMDSLKNKALPLHFYEIETTVDLAPPWGNTITAANIQRHSLPESLHEHRHPPALSAPSPAFDPKIMIQMRTASLSTPSSTLYTRPRMVDKNGVTVWGRKAWHYKEKKHRLTHAEASAQFDRWPS